MNQKAAIALLTLNGWRRFEGGPVAPLSISPEVTVGEMRITVAA